MAYGSLMPKGRYPLAVLFLDVPGAELDVNVHPQKLEVRFSRASEVYAAVRHVVGAGLVRAPWFAEAGGQAVTHSLPPAALDRGDDATDWTRANSALATRGSPRVEGNRSVRHPTYLRDVGQDVAFGAAQARSWPSLPAGGRPSLRTIVGRYVGRLDSGLLICDAGASIRLVDPHVLREQISLAQLCAAHERHELMPQTLLFPVPVTLDTADTMELAEFRRLSPVLRRIGIDVDAAEGGGGHGFVLRGLPQLVSTAAPKPLLQRLLLKLTELAVDAEVCESVVDELASALLPVLACVGSVRTDDDLSVEQIETWLSQVHFDDGVFDGGFACDRGAPLSRSVDLSVLFPRLSAP